MSTLAFYAQFTKTLVGVNSLSVTWDVEQITRSDGTRSALVTGGATSITIGRRGLYGYLLASADTKIYDYVATAITAGDVDQKEIAALWTMYEADTLKVSGDGTAADNAESFFDGTGYAGTNNVIPTVTTLTNMPAAAPTATANADAVWDELLSGHVGVGSAGLALATASSGGVDPSVLADAIWDEALSGHSTAGTTGKKLTDLVNADLSGVATQASVNDIPTVAEFEARTIPSADYVIVSDLPSVPSAATVADAVWDETQAGHVGAGTFGLYLDSEVSGAGGGGLTTGDIADAVWDEALAGHVIVGSAGAGLAAAGSAGDPWTTTLPGAYTGNQAGAILDAIRDVTDAIDVSAVTVTAANDAGVLTIIQAVTFNATESGLTISGTWAKLYWTLKESIYDDDDQAIIQLVESNPGAGTDGLLYLDSAAIVAPITVADGTLTVNQAAGTVAIVVTDNATKLLSAASDLVWDIKTKDAAGNTVQNTTGTASIVRAVTQTI